MFSLFTRKVAAAVGVPEKAGPAFVVPDSLPALQAKTGADLARLGDFKVGANAPESVSPSRFLSSALNEKQETLPATRAISRAMPENHAVRWAVDSSKTVSDKMSEPDRAALASAEKYLKEPSPSTQSAAAAAAAKTDFQGPGAWSAKAASLVGMTPANGPTVPAKAPPAPNLVAECVAGAVILAAVLTMGKSKQPAPPAAAAQPAEPNVPPTAVTGAASPATLAETQELNKALKPLIEHGLQLATKL